MSSPDKGVSSACTAGGGERGSGLGNVSHALPAGRWLIYRATHTRRDFVERPDFTTAPGFLDGPGARQRLRLRAGGPELCCAPLCTFDFDPATCAMRLRSLQPGVSYEQVAAQTGFALERPAQMLVTPPPTADELALLRQDIDRTGLLRRDRG